MTEIRRRVTGEDFIVTEKIKKVVTTANITTETVIRRSERAIVLDCGHLIGVTKFAKVPTSNTRCKQCEEK